MPCSEAIWKVCVRHAAPRKAPKPPINGPSLRRQSALTEHPQAAEHPCNVIQRCFLGRAHAAAVLPLSGILSYVACQQNGEQNVALILGKLGPDAPLTDGEAPTTYLRAAALVGMGEQARSVVEQNAALTTRAKSDLHRLYCHSAAQAIAENRYQDAHGLLTKAMEKE